MRLVAVLHGYPPGHLAGAEMMAHTMFKALAAKGVDVRVALTSIGTERGPYELDGVKVTPARRPGQIVAAIHDADVALTHLDNTQRVTSICRALRKPVVFLMHNTHDWTKWHLPPDAALTVYNSDWMARDFSLWWAKTWGEAIAMPRGIIVRPPVVADDYATTAAGPQDGCVTLVNLTEEKGAGVFYKLAERLPFVNFLGVEGSYGWQQIRRDLPNVRIIPRTTNMRDDVFARTRVLLMPSIYESWGRVACEALASGIPVVACPTPGLRESLGRAGVFVERSDLSGWEAKVHNLMGDPATWALRSGLAARRSRQLEQLREQDTTRWVNAVLSLAP